MGLALVDPLVVGPLQTEAEKEGAVADGSALKPVYPDAWRRALAALEQEQEPAVFAVFDALSELAAPLVGLAWMSRQSGSPSDGGVPVGFFFLFPVVFLSLLENGALFDVVSLPTLRTFWVAPGGWGRFYLSTAILVLAAASIVVLAIPAGGSGHLWGIAAIAVVSVMSSLVWLIYFRLLGRLAWFCADRTTAAEDEAEIKADSEAERNAEPDDED